MRFDLFRLTFLWTLPSFVKDREPELVTHEVIEDDHDDDVLASPFSISMPPARQVQAPVAPVTPRPVGSPHMAGASFFQNRPPRVQPPEITNEWARRAVGPTEAHRMRGVCSGCGSSLSIARSTRPVRVACPVCGRTRLLA